MRNTVEIPIDMIPEFDYSSDDAMRFKALMASELIQKGMPPQSVYAFCRTTQHEVESYENEINKIQELALV